MLDDGCFNGLVVVPVVTWASVRRAFAIVDPAGVSDVDERARGRLLQGITLPLTGIVLLSMFSFMPAIVPGAPALMSVEFIVTLSALPLLLLVNRLARNGHVAAAAMTFVAIGIVDVFLVAMADLRPAGAGGRLAFLVFPVIMAGLLTGPYSTLAVGILQTLTAVYLAQHAAYERFSDMAFPIWLVAMASGLLTTGSWLRERDRRLRQQAWAGLADAEERYRHIVEDLPDAVIVVSDDKVRFGNSRAEALFGHPHLVGVPLRELFDDDVGDIVAAVNDIRSGDRHALITGQQVRADDLDEPLAVEVAVAHAEFGGESSDLLIVRDVRERKRAEAAQRIADERLSEIARLEEVNQVKTSLLNTASHELNTPIAALRLQFHLLRKLPEGDTRRGRSLEVLERNVNRLANLVSDIIDVARQQSGKLALRYGVVDPAVLAREVIDFFEPKAEAGGVRVSMDIEAVELTADEERMTQVLVNLLSNALKFTPAGGEVKVVGRLIGTTYEIRVRDTGVGLTPSQIAPLFQPFTQVHETSRTKEGGTGLGLHISRGIVEAHGGTIWCESAGPGTGSTFAFAFPVAAPVALPTP